MQAVKSVKVTTIVDNLVYDGRLLGQHGYSAHVEVTDTKGEKHSIVFDSGSKKGATLHNVKMLKLDLTPVEAVVLSHGHYDHTSSTVELIKQAKRRVKVVVHPKVFFKRFILRQQKRRCLGIPQGQGKSDMQEAGADVVETTRPIEILPGVLTSGEIRRVVPFEKMNWKVKMINNGKTTMDNVPDDQALFVNVERHGLLVLTGCAHAGIVNTIQHALDSVKPRKLYGFIGGTHLVGCKENRLKETMKRFEDFDMRLISPAHCTGFKATSALSQAFPRSFVLNYAGRTIDTARKLKDAVF